MIGHMSVTPPTFTQFPLPAGFSVVNSPIVTLGGAVWFQMSNGSTNAIARMTTAGAVSQFAVNQFAAPIHGMTVGSDGAIWITESANRIGRVNPAGGYSFFSTAGYNPYGIVNGPDGNLWFTGVSGSSGVSAIGLMTTSGSVETEPLSVPVSQSAANPIAVGPDGALWFMIDPAGSNPAGVERIATSGVVAGEYTQASTLYNFQAGSIAPGPDGRMWFTGTNGLGEITTDGNLTITIEHLASTVGEGIVEGSDGGMWYADALNNQLIRATTSTSTGGTLGVSPSSVGFNAVPGQLPAPQTVQITSTSGTISYGITTQYTSAAPSNNWIGLSSTSGSASPSSPNSVTISVTNAALTFPPGRYTANVNINATSGDPTVAVTFNIGQPTLIPPTVMVFGALAGSPAPAGPQDPQILVVGSSGSAISFTYTIQAGAAAGGPSACNAQATASLPANAPWLIVNGSTTTGSGTTGQNLIVSVQPAGLGPGTYVDYINLLPQGSTSSIPVEVYLVVQNSPGTFNFSYTTGGSAPASQTTGTMFSTCNVAAVNIQVGYASDQNWLSAQVNASGSGFAVTLAATPSASMSAGVYYGMVAITDLAGEVSVALCVLTVTTPGPAKPAILAGGIVNAASYAQANGVGSPVAPGSLVAIFTSQLATTAGNFSTATLPPVLSGVKVTFNGFPAPMVAVSPTGTYPYVSVQVPFEVLAAGQSSTTAQVVISVNNVQSAPAPIQIVASQPGIFTLNAQGTGQAVLVNLADYTIAAPSGNGAHPIPRGQSAFFYVTGLGALTPSVTDGSGACPAASGLCNANATPNVFVGGIQAHVIFAGQAPGFPGVSQINIAIPANAPTGSSVALTVMSADGSVTSNTGTIAVQ
jgi:uncharacterized protein (TIGR03437 family)